MRQGDQRGWGTQVQGVPELWASSARPRRQARGADPGSLPGRGLEEQGCPLLQGWRGLGSEGDGPAEGCRHPAPRTGAPGQGQADAWELPDPGCKVRTAGPLLAFGRRVLEPGPGRAPMAKASQA